MPSDIEDKKPENKVVTYKKEFDEKGNPTLTQDQMMDKALEDANKAGFEKISVQTDRPGAWTVLFYS